MTYMRVVSYMPSHTDTLYICMCSQSAPPPSVHAHRQTCTPCTLPPVRARPRMHTPMHGLRGCTLNLPQNTLVIISSAWEGGFAVSLTLLVHFWKLKLKYPQRDECTERGILSWCSPLSLTSFFSVLLFPFDCKGHVFPCMTTLQKKS